MAHLNIKERVIETKVVYYGAGLSGKTTNLEQIKRLSVGGKCGDLMSVDTDGDRTLFFDWLPMQIGKFNGCDVKVQLFTVPGQAKYAETRKKVLAGADGVVLVLDSQSGALERNVQVLSDLRDHLREHKLENLPVVVQLNKRDLPTALPVEELLAFVGVGSLPFVPASAASGEGVFETLREMIRHVLMHVRDQARDSAGDIRAGSESALDGHTLYGQISDGMANAPALAARGPEAKVGQNEAPAENADADTSTLVSMEARSFAAPAKVANGDRFTDVAARAAYSSGVGAVIAPSASEFSAPPAAKSRPVDARPASGSEGVRDTQLSEIIASSRQVLRRVDHLEAQMEKAVANSFVDLERKLLGRLGDTLVERITGKMEGSLTPLVSRFDTLEEAVASLAKTHVTLALMQESLGKEVARMATRLGELATDTSATKEATARHVSRLADLAVELGGLKDASAGLEARATERGAALDSAVDRVGKDVQRLASMEATIAEITKKVDVLPNLSNATSGLADRLATLEGAQAQVEGAIAAMSQELRTVTEVSETFHMQAAGRAATTAERLGKVDAALSALIGEHQRLAEVTKGASDATRTSVTEQRLGIARVEEAVGKGNSAVEAVVRAATETFGAQVEKANRMQDAASKGTVQRLIDLSAAVRELDGRLGNELGGVTHASNELSKVIGTIEARVSQNFSVAVNQIGKLVDGQTATLQRGTMGLVADVGLAKSVLDELTNRVERISESVQGIKGLGDDVRRVGSSVDGGSTKQQALLQETRIRLDGMGERVARITEVMNELSAEMKKPKSWFRG